MEDFLLLLLFFIFYFVAGSSKKKKKKDKKQTKARPGPMRTRAQGEQADMQASARDKQTIKGFQSAFGDVDQHAVQPCEQQSIHLHEVSQTHLHEAGEGEDPCHMGGINAESQLEERLEESDEAQKLRQDILRGVIMNEILTRPCERMAMRRGGR